MKQSTQGNIQKNITLTPDLFYTLLLKARDMGLDFQDYVRLILAASVKEDIPLVDEETEKRIGQALQDLKEGRYTIVSTQEELHEHLDKL
ncbi:MAG TPA: hypothetical protein VJH96_00265 [Patescibacteria group bacterium]|nr:hypothetical protein [Patescibacteria group bacterium]